MRTYRIYSGRWTLLGIIKADGIEDAREVAKQLYPSHAHVSVDWRANRND